MPKVTLTLPGKVLKSEVTTFWNVLSFQPLPRNYDFYQINFMSGGVLSDNTILSSMLFIYQGTVQNISTFGFDMPFNVSAAVGVGTPWDNIVYVKSAQKDNVYSSTPCYRMIYNVLGLQSQDIPITTNFSSWISSTKALAEIYSQNGSPSFISIKPFVANDSTNHLGLWTPYAVKNRGNINFDSSFTNSYTLTGYWYE